ncbi:rab proteins geranylgeranyltransferase component A [Rhypophila decipiens]|uniref:Rab proteins geranylgeranyltransferase n=1 Tax=Rhypophila decipiens TaxID=261697 RepID=A0AAN7BCN7_9PEZI|nr:rab proteins geranylgeranyltransferase component A [Rhypophila decipiens]
MGENILADTLWDVVICGTDLPQCLLALSLSRSDKKVLHIDPNTYYGGSEAALTLQDADEWAARLSTQESNAVFKAPTISRSKSAPNLSTRAYSLALGPQFIHARSELLSQLVSSRAAQQVDFLAVGSFFISKAASDGQRHSMIRIPSTREDVFTTTALSMKAKRALMKFLKFVLNYEGSENADTWKPHAEAPLAQFVEDHFKMDLELRSYIIALTLSIDGKITTQDGLAVIHRHLTSMGVFGPGFAAVYPKWGGLAEIAQVSCRAGAVGGAVYMLGTDIKDTKTVDSISEVELTSGDKIKTRLIVKGNGGAEDGTDISRLVAVIGSSLKALFTATVEGAPIPAVVVVAFPADTLTAADGTANKSPVYLFAHSSDTGECPSGQSVLYLTTSQSPHSKEVLGLALEKFLGSGDEPETPQALYTLCYDQSGGQLPGRQADDLNMVLPSLPLSLAFDDTVLKPVHDAWKHVMGETAVDAEYMTFPERNGGMDDNDDDAYE